MPCCPRLRKFLNRFKKRSTDNKNTNPGIQNPAFGTETIVRGSIIPRPLCVPLPDYESSSKDTLSSISSQSLNSSVASSSGLYNSNNSSNLSKSSNMPTQKKNDPTNYCPAFSVTQRRDLCTPHKSGGEEGMTNYGNSQVRGYALDPSLNPFGKVPPVTIKFVKGPYSDADDSSVPKKSILKKDRSTSEPKQVSFCDRITKFYGDGENTVVTSGSLKTD